MFKLISLAIGFYFLYQLFNNQDSLDAGPEKSHLDDEDDYIDYEEVE